jgi:lysophospholipase L1-like esterase
MQHRRFLLLIALLVLPALLFLLRDDNSWTNYPSEGEGIVAFGDSLMVGVGASKGRSLPELLAQSIGEPVLNVGRSGDTTRDALGRVPEVLASVPNPEVVIILLGGNDYLQKIPSEETFQNLETIIRTFQSRGAVVLLLGIRGGILRDGFGKDFERLADKMETPFISDVFNGVWGTPSRMSDAIHPNDDGYAIIGGRITPVLLTLIKPL